MIIPLKQIPITIAKTPTPPSAEFSFPIAGNLQQKPQGALRGANLEGLPPPRPPTPIVAAALLLNPRCKIRGCVFPASDLATGMCHSHDLQEIEPELFQSFQPVLYVLQQGRYGIPEQSFDNPQFHKPRLLFGHRIAPKKGAP
jgi:hypothetical protein